MSSAASALSATSTIKKGQKGLTGPGGFSWVVHFSAKGDFYDNP